MDATAKEAAMKRKLQQFLLEMFKMGTVRGFQHFSIYIRGKEELGVTVFHEPQMSRRCSVIQPDIVQPGESLSSARLPYDPGALMLSQGTQQVLSGMGDQGVGLPPASPSDNETDSECSTNSTLFLVAGYARYSCPYVWVRSNHRRLMRLSGTDDSEKDNPLRLKSTARWQDGDVNIWEIIAELVKLCMYPAPRNPFAVDLNYFLSLPLPQQVLSSAAMVTCLQKIILHTPDDRPYAGKVLDELQLVSRLHYTAFQSLAKQHQLPVLEQHLQQQSKTQAQRKRGSLSQSRNRYPSTDSQGSSYPQQQYGDMSVQSTQGVYMPQGSAHQGFPGYGFTPAPSLF